MHVAGCTCTTEVQYGTVKCCRGAYCFVFSEMYQRQPIFVRLTTNFTPFLIYLAINALTTSEANLYANNSLVWDDVIATGTASCPVECTCTDAGRALTIDCRRRTDNASSLLDEMDAILSGRQSDLTSLTINNSSLTLVPWSVCQLTKLDRLNLDGNQLTELPGNCFTRMRQLTELSARTNKLTKLQVSFVKSAVINFNECRYSHFRVRPSCDRFIRTPRYSPIKFLCTKAFISISSFNAGRHGKIWKIHGKVQYISWCT
jgi:hypothetical protein